MGERDGVTMLQDGTYIADCKTLDLDAGDFLVTPFGDECVVQNIGGGGGAPPVVSFSTCSVIDGTVPLFLGASTCVDPAELAVQTRVKNAATFDDLACELSADTGAQTVTITGRVGACGGSLGNSALICTIGPGASSCQTVATTMSVSAGQCIALRLSATGALPSRSNLNCTMERVA
jgi:hypothetical protein